jgi:hypothetical protein
MTATESAAREASTRRRWQWFLAIEGMLVLFAGAMIWVSLALRIIWLGYVCVPLIAWLIVTLPIAFLYLIGHPPVMSLAPLIPSAESRAFRKEVRARPILEDDEFYARFYGDSGVSPDIVAKVRKCVTEWVPLAERAIPTDNLGLLDDELDFVDVLHWIGNEFDIRFTRADYPLLDGTLGSLIRLVRDRFPISVRGGVSSPECPAKRQTPG